ncbi:MAG: M42 family peptidase [Ruminococcus sp.]|nr:M42 family peptidase [Ruminococcus sp.]
MEIFDILSKLCPAFGVSGEEHSAASAAADLLKEYGECEYLAKNGDLRFFRKGFEKNKKTILLDAHIDEIGLIVTDITDDGFLKVSAVGGVDRRMLLASKVTVFGKQPVRGVITSTPPHLEKDSSDLPEVGDIYIDVGLSGDKASELISRGDKACVVNTPVKFIGTRVSGKALDDRSGIAVIIRTLEMLKDVELNVNIAALLSSKEEIGEMGAKTGAFDIDAEWAVAIDVSFAYVPGDDREHCGELSKGAMIGVAPSLSRELSDGLISFAKENIIPYQLEIMGGRTGTNADEISVSHGGIKTVTLSVPEKYMHTPAEVIDTDDIENTAKLLSGFIRGLE